MDDLSFPPVIPVYTVPLQRLVGLQSSQAPFWSLVRHPGNDRGARSPCQAPPSAAVATNFPMHMFL